MKILTKEFVVEHTRGEDIAEIVFSDGINDTCVFDLKHDVEYDVDSFLAAISPLKTTLGWVPVVNYFSISYSNSGNTLRVMYSMKKSS